MSATLASKYTLIFDHPLSFAAQQSGWLKHERAYGGWLGNEEPMKDVAACDKLRGGGKQPLIRRFPNGETPLNKFQRPTIEYIDRVEGTRGSETSQYPEEKRIKQ